MNLPATAAQTIGPFFRIGLEHLYVNDLAPHVPASGKIAIYGRVLDGEGKAVNDAVLEIWQADAQGVYAHPEDARGKAVTPGFRGFGRVVTGGDGAFRFTTIKPGCVAGPHRIPQAPHLLVGVFMRGLLIQLVTRMYFPQDPDHAIDPVLNLVPVQRRASLIARPSGDALEWNVILQGENETVFFDY